MTPQGNQVGNATYERKGTDVTGVFFLVALLLLLLTICLLAVGGFIHLLKTQRPSPVASRNPAAFPAPRLQVAPRVDRLRDQAAQQKQFNSYGWVEREKGVAHIPIERAMQLLVERGLPEVGIGQTRLQLMQARPQTSLQPRRAVADPSPGATP